MRARSIGCLTLLAAAACGPEAPTVPAPPPECVAAWAEQESRELVDVLVRATGADRAVWTGYDVGDGAYLLYASAPDSSGTCVGLWHDGGALGFALTPEEPSLLTPLYGYYFRSDWHGGPDAPMLAQAAQPTSVREWLESSDVSTAVVMPVIVADFPIALPAHVKVQLALHEAFHLEVQAPRWYASTGDWPAWDRQPDRAGVGACYTASDEVSSALAAERGRLVSLVESLIDGDTTRACEMSGAFLAERTARHELLKDVHVARADGTPGTCAEAEAIMELEEGTADYASWAVLYDLGLASRESLIGRYTAQQDEMFYLTGAMQLHALQLMRPDRMAEIMDVIARSGGPEEGSLAALLGAATAAFCPTRAEAP